MDEKGTIKEMLMTELKNLHQLSDEMQKASESCDLNDVTDILIPGLRGIHDDMRAIAVTLMSIKGENV